MRNRFIVAPMTRDSATDEGVPTAAMQEYYEAMAKGGFAAIITEGTYTDTFSSKALPNQPGIVTKDQILAWKIITDRIHMHGSLAISQLMHAGALSFNDKTAIAPSEVRPVGSKMNKAGLALEMYAVPIEMDKADFEKVIDGFVKSARNAELAGFDGIEIHAANGYLLDQFLTPHTNTRTDQYGGSIENRFRIIREIFGRIKEVVSPEFIIGLRVSESKVNDLKYRWPDGANFAKELFREVAKCDFFYIHIAAEGGNWARECLYPDGSSSTNIARKITGIPVIANGGLHDLSKAQELLDTGHADLFSIGRAAIADPEWVNKVKVSTKPRSFEKGMISPLFNLENTRRYFENEELCPK